MSASFDRNPGGGAFCGQLLEARQAIAAHRIAPLSRILAVILGIRRDQRVEPGRPFRKPGVPLRGGYRAGLVGGGAEAIQHRVLDRLLGGPIAQRQPFAQRIGGFGAQAFDIVGQRAFGLAHGLHDGRRPIGIERAPALRGPFACAWRAFGGISLSRQDRGEIVIEPPRHRLPARA